MSSLTGSEHGHTGGDHVPEHCPACGLQVRRGGGRPELALARSDRFVAVLSTSLVEQPESGLLYLNLY